MTYNPMQAVSNFHDKFHQNGEDRHAIVLTVDDMYRRGKLITEEYEEVMNALYEFEETLGTEYSLAAGAELAKELADLLYVVYGTADEMGIDLRRVFNAVHESNMSKVWDDGKVHYNEYGKVLKPPTYKAPDIKAILNGTA